MWREGHSIFAYLALYNLNEVRQIVPHAVNFPLDHRACTVLYALTT